VKNNCLNCGEVLFQKRGRLCELTHDGRMICIEDAEWEECPECGERTFGYNAWARLDAAEKSPQNSC